MCWKRFQGLLTYVTLKRLHFRQNIGCRMPKAVICIVTDVCTAYLTTVKRFNCGGWINTPMCNNATRTELNVTNLNQIVV
jgi:hypothetical protein